MENYQTSNILFLEFSHSEFFQLNLPINAIFPMLGRYTSKLQITASLKYNISSTSSVEYRCLSILGLHTLETRFLRADLIEVFKILRGFENLDPDRFFQVIGDGARRGTVLNCSGRCIVWTWGSSSRILGADVTSSLVSAFVTTRMDYCDSILAALPQSSIDPLQRVQNAAAMQTHLWHRNTRAHHSSA